MDLTKIIGKALRGVGREQVLSEVVKEEMLEEHSRGFFSKYGRRIYSVAKVLASPTALGAGFGYLSSGLDGAQQGAVVGAALGSVELGLGYAYMLFQKDDLAEPGLKNHEFFVKNLKDDVEMYEEGKTSVRSLQLTLTSCAMYSLFGWIGGAPVGLAAKIGLGNGLFHSGKCYRRGKEYSRKMDKHIEQRRVERMEGPYVDVDALGT